jgi:hypothetical protein
MMPVTKPASMFSISALEAYAPYKSSSTSFAIDSSFALKPTATSSPQAPGVNAADVSASSKGRFRFNIKDLFASLGDLSSAVVDLLARLIKKICQILGVPVSVAETKDKEGNVDGLQVNMQTDKDGADMVYRSTSEATKEIIKKSLETHEPQATIADLGADFAKIAARITKFETDWMLAHPDMALADAVKTDVMPEVSRYKRDVESSKLIVLSALSLKDQYGLDCDDFPAEISLAMQAVERDLQANEAAQLEQLDPHELSSNYESYKAVLAKNVDAPADATAVALAEDARSSALRVAAQMYSIHPEKRSQMSPVLLADVEALVAARELLNDTSREADSVQSGAISTNISPSVPQSGNSINGIDAAASGKVVPIFERSSSRTKDAAPFLPASVVPGLMEQKGAGVVLPPYHESSPRNDSVKPSRFGARVQQAILASDPAALGGEELPESARVHQDRRSERE